MKFNLKYKSILLGLMFTSLISDDNSSCPGLDVATKTLPAIGQQAIDLRNLLKIAAFIVADLENTKSDSTFTFDCSCPADQASDSTCSKTVAPSFNYNTLYNTYVNDGSSIDDQFLQDEFSCTTALPTTYSPFSTCSDGEATLQFTNMNYQVENASQTNNLPTQITEYNSAQISESMLNCCNNASNSGGGFCPLPDGCQCLNVDSNYNVVSGNQPLYISNTLLPQQSQQSSSTSTSSGCGSPGSCSSNQTPANTTAFCVSGCVCAKPKFTDIIANHIKLTGLAANNGTITMQCPVCEDIYNAENNLILIKYIILKFIQSVLNSGTYEIMGSSYDIYTILLDLQSKCTSIINTECPCNKMDLSKLNFNQIKNVNINKLLKYNIRVRGTYFLDGKAKRYCVIRDTNQIFTLNDVLQYLQATICAINSILNKSVNSLGTCKANLTKEKMEAANTALIAASHVLMRELTIGSELGQIAQKLQIANSALMITSIFILPFAEKIGNWIKKVATRIAARAGSASGSDAEEAAINLLKDRLSSMQSWSNVSKKTMRSLKDELNGIKDNADLDADGVQTAIRTAFRSVFSDAVIKGDYGMMPEASLGELEDSVVDLVTDTFNEAINAGADADTILTVTLESIDAGIDAIPK